MQSEVAEEASVTGTARAQVSTCSLPGPRVTVVCQSVPRASLWVAKTLLTICTEPQDQSLEHGRISQDVTEVHSSVMGNLPLGAE